MKNLSRILYSLLFMLLLSGCGYHLPGGGSGLPDDIQKVVIVQFSNRTAQPFVETGLTNEVRDQFNRRRTLDVVANEKDADAVLSGAVSAYSSSALSYDEDDDITHYRVDITVEAQLKRVADGEIIWQGNVSWHEDFRSSPDRARQEYNERIVQVKINRRLAQEVYNRITDNF